MGCVMWGDNTSEAKGSCYRSQFEQMDFSKQVSSWITGEANFGHACRIKEVERQRTGMRREEG